MNIRHRTLDHLTLGFLTLGAQAMPLDVIHAAADAGFSAAGLRISGRHPGDAWPSVDNDAFEFQKIRALSIEKSVRISSVAGYYLTPKTRLEHLLSNVRAAQELGAPLIAQGCFDGDHARIVPLLREYAHAANDVGVRIALEFMPMSELKNLKQTQEVIASSGATNIGLLIDALHLARSGGSTTDIRALDPQSIYLTQLCDAPGMLSADSTLFEEAMSGRFYLGDGSLALADLVNALPVDAEIELETPVAIHATLDSTQQARYTAETSQRFFDRHFSVVS